MITTLKSKLNMKFWRPDINWTVNQKTKWTVKQNKKHRTCEHKYARGTEILIRTQYMKIFVIN